jgi:hypothetical protein
LGLFSTVTHVFKRNVDEVDIALSSVVLSDLSLPKQATLDFTSDTLDEILNKKVYGKSGVFYLLVSSKNNWSTIVEANVNIEPEKYLYELNVSLSRKAATTCISLHLHDDDVLLYNIDERGKSVDGYSSNPQYFLDEPMEISEIEAQKHDPRKFRSVLPFGKSTAPLENILNQGYWNAYEKNELDEDGLPNEDVFVDEQERMILLGKYLEVYAPEVYPFSSWGEDLKKIGNLQIRLVSYYD